jgi:hypothetical protein
VRQFRAEVQAVVVPLSAVVAMEGLPHLVLRAAVLVAVNQMSQHTLMAARAVHRAMWMAAQRVLQAAR